MKLSPAASLSSCHIFIYKATDRFPVAFYNILANFSCYPCSPHQSTSSAFLPLYSAPLLQGKETARNTPLLPRLQTSDIQELIDKKEQCYKGTHFFPFQTLFQNLVKTYFEF